MSAVWRILLAEIEYLTAACSADMPASTSSMTRIRKPITNGPTIVYLPGFAESETAPKT